MRDHPGGKGPVIALALKQRGAEQMMPPQPHIRVTSRAFSKLRRMAAAAR